MVGLLFLHFVQLEFEVVRVVLVKNLHVLGLR